jgi:hypothetical protein
MSGHRLITAQPDMCLFSFLEPECGLVVVTSIKSTQPQPTTSSYLSQILKEKPPPDKWGGNTGAGSCRSSTMTKLVMGVPAPTSCLVGDEEHGSGVEAKTIGRDKN